MDVSGWTIDQRMRLPDWCFGNRQIIGVNKAALNLGTMNWEISTLALPADICIWHIGFFLSFSEPYSSYCRIGLTSALPTNEAEMDAAVEVLTYFGDRDFTPRRIYFSTNITEPWQFPLRRGLATGGKKLTLEVYCGITKIEVTAYMVFSELPTDMASWLAHKKV